MAGGGGAGHLQPQLLLPPPFTLRSMAHPPLHVVASVETSASVVSLRLHPGALYLSITPRDHDGEVDPVVDDATVDMQGGACQGVL